MIFLCDWPECTFLTRWRGTLDTHRQRHTGIRPLPCPYDDCEKTFFCTRDLNIHKRTHSGEKPYSCQSCDKRYTQKGQLNSHIRRYHPEAAEAKSPQRKYPCLTCGKQLKTHDGLQIHAQTHTRSKPFVCQECGRGFVSKSNLRTHQTLHMPNAMMHECTQCGKAFRLRTMLQEHLLSHSGHRPFACSICSRGFKRKQQLEAHMNTHTGATPYKCLECGAKFRSSSRLCHHRRKCFSTATTPLVLATPPAVDEGGILECIPIEPLFEEAQLGFGGELQE